MLEVRNISYSVGKKNILHEISFNAGAGRFIAVLGPNGAGKSTLLKLISRELMLQHGNVLFNGKDIYAYTINEMALQRGVMTQSITMSSDFEVEEVVMMGRYPHFKSAPKPEDFKAVDHSLAITETQKLRNRNYPSLSGGEQQRIQLARVMSQVHGAHSKPKMLLLDEPLNNLDIKHQHKTLDIAIDFAKQGNIVLAVLHDINLAALYADELLLMHQGKLKSYGTPNEVIREDLLSECYDFPVRVDQHPYHHTPVVYFGCPAIKEHESINQLNYDTQIQH